MHVNFKVSDVVIANNHNLFSFRELAFHMKAQIVSFHCILKNTLGQVISTSFNRDVITHLPQGEAMEVPALAAGLQEVKPGEHREISVSADQAYGLYNPALVRTVSRERLTATGAPAVGDRVHLADEHGDFRLYETQAVLRYLDRVLPNPALTPGDPRRAARMDQAMNINDWYLFQGVGSVIVFHRVVGPRVLGTAPDEAAIAAAMPKAHAVFNVLALLLGDKSYFAGDTVSLADLMLAPAIEMFTFTPEWSALGEPHANLVAWIARMQQRPSMKATTWERVSELAKAA